MPQEREAVAQIAEQGRVRGSNLHALAESKAPEFPLQTDLSAFAMRTVVGNWSSPALRRSFLAKAWSARRYRVSQRSSGVCWLDANQAFSHCTRLAIAIFRPFGYA